MGKSTDFKRLVFSATILILLMAVFAPQEFAIQLAKAEPSYSLGVEWERTYNWDRYDNLIDMVQTTDGGFALVGDSTDYYGNTVVWLVKINSMGQIEWNQTYSWWGANSHGLIQTSDEGYAILGLTGSNPNFDFFLLKTDQNGTEIWHDSYNTGITDYPQSLVQTSDGGYALAGYVATQPSSSTADGLLIRTDDNGFLQWNKTYGGSKGDMFSSLTQTSDGGYAMAGRYTDYGDFWLVKTDSTGALQVNKTYGGAGQDLASSLIQTEDGGFAISGYINWPSGNMLVKTDANGVQNWSRSYGTGLGADVFRRREGGFALTTVSSFLELDSDGNIQAERLYPLGQSFPGGTTGFVAVQTDDGGYALASTAVVSSNPYLTDFYMLKIAGKDTDQDGLFDLWEQKGIDLNNDGKLELNLKALGAEPLYKDLFVEVDYMINHKPNAEAINDVVTAFKNAPVLNPNGTSGINLHVIVDDELPHVDNIKLGNDWADFNTFKWGFFANTSDRANSNWPSIREAKHRVFRYCLFIHNWDATNSSGIAEWFGNDFIVSLGGSFSKIGGHGVGSRDEQAGTFMHELGHTLSLGHGGGDDINAKPNYVSIMSYPRQFSILLPGRALDYSRAKLPSLNESNLDENLGIQFPPGSLAQIAYGPLEVSPGSAWPHLATVPGAIDWNFNGHDNDTGVSLSINDFTYWEYGDNITTVLEGYDDWANIKLDFRNSKNYADGVHSQVVSQEITWEIVQLMRNETTGDTNPPVTNHNYNGAWYTQDFTITLAATDDLSGVSETFYKINGGLGRNVTANGHPRIAVEGANSTLEYWSLDNSGNEETPHKTLIQIKLDKTSPTGTIQVNNGAAYANSTTVSLKLFAADTGSGVSQMRFANDGSAWSIWEPYSNLKAWNVTAGDGVKNVFVQYSDLGGLNVTGYASITLDMTPPSASAGQNQTVLTGTSVAFNGSGSTDNTGIASYLWDFGDGTTGTGAAPTHAYANAGTYAARLTVVDMAGNSAASTATVTIEVIIPEFPSASVLTAIMILLSAIAVVFRRKKSI